MYYWPILRFSCIIFTSSSCLDKLTVLFRNFEPEMHSGTKLIRQIGKWTKTGIKIRKTWISSQRFEFKPPPELTVLWEVLCMSWLKNNPTEQLLVNISLYTIVHSRLCSYRQSFSSVKSIFLLPYNLPTFDQNIITFSMWTFRNLFLCCSHIGLKKSIKVLKSM